jgi:hypothetical protein
MRLAGVGRPEKGVHALQNARKNTISIFLEFSVKRDASASR